MLFIRKAALALLPALVLSSAASTPAHAARGGAVYSSGPTIALVADLPETGSNGGLDLGYMYEHFSLFWMPVWGSGEGTYVMYRDTSDGWQYKAISDAEAEMVATLTGATVSKPGFLARFWGLFAILGVIGGFIGWNLLTNGTVRHHSVAGRRA